MYTNTALIIWSLVALVIGFVAGYLVGLFRWKNSPKKAEAEATAIKDGWEKSQADFQAQIDELKKKIEDAKADASKKP